jgi:hypothetical protein
MEALSFYSSFHMVKCTHVLRTLFEDVGGDMGKHIFQSRMKRLHGVHEIRPGLHPKVSRTCVTLTLLATRLTSICVYYISKIQYNAPVRNQPHRLRQNYRKIYVHICFCFLNVFIERFISNGCVRNTG